LCRSTEALQSVFAEEWGRVTAALIRRFRDWDLAEEAVAEAFAEAARRWPAEGVPARPGAWLTTVAANRALDRLRRARRESELLERVGAEPLAAGSEPSTEEVAVTELSAEESGTIKDDRLRLIFTCCHPALALEARVALTLRMLGGLSTAEIARALLVGETTMAKRLTRAKAKIAAAAIPYRVPPPELLPERTGGVLAVLYLMFNEGYLASAGNELTRTDLSAEAIRLTRLLVALMPDEPEATGLLALMLFNDARRAARIGPGGELIPLESQDRGSWDRARIDEAAVLLDRGLRRGPAGPYLLQAAIAALHCQAATQEDTDWSEIAALYTLLLVGLDTPVVRLNRAVATAMARDIDAGLEELAALEADPRLAGYHLLPAARGDLLRRRGDGEAAAVHYRRALALVRTEPERRFILARLQELGH
jgi:RNA polymerase sigma-70 factor (ECF subfamily)